MAVLATDSSISDAGFNTAPIIGGVSGTDMYLVYTINGDADLAIAKVNMGTGTVDATWHLCDLATKASVTSIPYYTAAVDLNKEVIAITVIALVGGARQWILYTVELTEPVTVVDDAHIQTDHDPALSDYLQVALVTDKDNIAWVMGTNFRSMGNDLTRPAVQRKVSGSWGTAIQYTVEGTYISYTSLINIANGISTGAWVNDSTRAITYQSGGSVVWVSNARPIVDSINLNIGPIYSADGYLHVHGNLTATLGGGVTIPLIRTTVSSAVSNNPTWENISYGAAYPDTDGYVANVGHASVFHHAPDSKTYLLISGYDAGVAQTISVLVVDITVPASPVFAGAVVDKEPANDRYTIFSYYDYGQQKIYSVARGFSNGIVIYENDVPSPTAANNLQGAVVSTTSIATGILNEIVNTLSGDVSSTVSRIDIGTMSLGDIVILLRTLDPVVSTVSTCDGFVGRGDLVGFVTSTLSKAQGYAAVIPVQTLTGGVVSSLSTASGFSLSSKVSSYAALGYITEKADLDYGVIGFTIINYGERISFTAMTLRSTIETGITATIIFDLDEAPVLFDSQIHFVKVVGGVTEGMYTFSVDNVEVVKNRLLAYCSSDNTRGPYTWDSVPATFKRVSGTETSYRLVDSLEVLAGDSINVEGATRLVRYAVHTLSSGMQITTEVQV